MADQKKAKQGLFAGLVLGSVEDQDPPDPDAPRGGERQADDEEDG